MGYEFEPACSRMEWLDPFYKAVWEKAFVDAIPISGTFELTPRCNFRCRMCYVHLEPSEIPKYGKELTAREWIRIAKGAKASRRIGRCMCDWRGAADASGIRDDLERIVADGIFYYSSNKCVHDRRKV